MKIILLAAMAVVASTAAEACILSDSDFQALAVSPSHLNRGDFAALSSEKQNLVCDTRAFIKKVDAQKGVINESGTYAIRYLTAAEFDRVGKAVNEYLVRLPTAKGR